MIKMTDLNLNQQRVIIREDFNVPIESGRVVSDARLRAALPTLQRAVQQQAGVMVLSHLGRPSEGVFEEQFSMAPVAQRLGELCPEIPVHFSSDWLSNGFVKPGEIVVCENVRFNQGEKDNEMMLSKRMAELCDIFVMDAFATAHRAQASTYGIAQFAPIACAGPLLVAELEALTKSFASPEHPLIAIVGGSKVSTKLEVLTTLMTKVDGLILGGGIANTFLAAKGYSVGASLYEPALIQAAQKLIALAEQRNVTLFLPEDVVTSTKCSEKSIRVVKSLEDVENDEMILDVGLKTSQNVHAALQQAKTIIWNGPLGVFELDPFSEGTKNLALSIAASQAYTIAGGGDTLAAIEKYKVENKISYLSTGGGAFLEFLENKKLPAIEILEKRANELNSQI